MSGLAHVFEEAGIPTTVVSLIREHTEKMRPPRALWVPFELGRPFGPPDMPDLQGRVLEHALRLLEAPAGPVLQDFPEEAPAAAGEEAAWACPVQFGAPPATGAAADDLRSAVQREMALLLPWYERARSTRGRSTVGVSGLPLPEILAELCAPLDPLFGEDVARSGLADRLRLAAEDLKAFYTEAGSAQPGAASSEALLQWFWHDTSASRLLRSLQAHFANSDDEALQLLSSLLLVPRSQSGEPT